MNENKYQSIALYIKCTFFCEMGFAATTSTGPAAAGPACFFFGGMSGLGVVGQALVFCITPSAACCQSQEIY
jgi:hypothetical protein